MSEKFGWDEEDIGIILRDPVSADEQLEDGDEADEPEALPAED